MNNDDKAICEGVLPLYQTLSPSQLAALDRDGWRQIEPGCGAEPYCSLKLKQRYAEMIARKWMVPEHGAGYVVRLLLPLSALENYQLETVAYDEHLEYCVPARDLPRLSRKLIGQVRMVSAFREYQSYSVPRNAPPLAALMG